MKLQIWKKLAAGMMIAALLAGTLAGCGQKDENNSHKRGPSGDVDITYPMKEKVTLKVAMLQLGSVSAHADNLMETPFGKAWQEATGVEIILDTYGNDTALNLMYAGGELPDIIIHGMGSYSGGCAAAIEDGIIQPLNDYMAYAPDYQAVLDSNETWRRGATTSNGDIVGFSFIRSERGLMSPLGFVYREEYLKELGKEVPQTLDEFYQLLVALKGKGVKYPLNMNFDGINNQFLSSGLITSAFGLVNSGFYQVDGKVHYGAIEPEFKEALTFLKKLYDEELLNSNFATVSSETIKANMLNGSSGVTTASIGQDLSAYVAETRSRQDFHLVPGNSLTKNAGDTPKYGWYRGAQQGYFAVITPQCKNIEAAVQFLNYGYTEEGSRLFNYGIEGKSYTMEDGKPVYTDLIKNNPDGWTTSEAMAQYTLSWWAGPFVQKSSVLDAYDSDIQRKAAALWPQTDAEKYGLGDISIARSDLNDYSRLKGDIETYYNEMVIKFIEGKISLNQFESEYLNTMKQQQVDRLVEIYQHAVDDYLAR